MISSKQPKNKSNSSIEHQIRLDEHLDSSLKVKTSLHKDNFDEQLVYVGPATERDNTIAEEQYESSNSHVNRGKNSISWREFLHQRPGENESEYYMRLMNRKKPKDAATGKHGSMPNLPGISLRASMDEENLENRIKKLEEILMAKVKQDLAVTDRQDNPETLACSEQLLSQDTKPQLRSHPTSSSLLPKKRDKFTTLSMNPEQKAKRKRCQSPVKNRRRRHGQGKNAQGRGGSPVGDYSTKKKERTKEADHRVTPHQNYVSFKKTVRKHRSHGRKGELFDGSLEKKLRKQSVKASLKEQIANIQERIQKAKLFISTGDLMQIQRELELMKIIEQMHSQVVKSIKTKLAPAERQVILRSSKQFSNVAVSLRSRYG